MTNNFATVKDNAGSEKFYLVRLNPGRSIVDDLTVVTGFRYSMTFPFQTVNDVKVNGTSFTLVTTTPNAGEYSFDEDTLTLTVTLSQAISNYQNGDGNIVAYYYLFYTNDTDRDTYETPDDNTTTSRYWQARLKGAPQFTVDQSDIIDGFLTIGNTTVEIINNDNDFNQYLTSKDSFAFKDVSIWQCIDSVDNIQKFYLGQISNISIDNTVSLSLDSSLNKLDKSVINYQTIENNKFTYSNYPYLHPDSVDEPIYKIYSFRSKFVTNYENTEYFQYHSWLKDVYREGYKLINTLASVDDAPLGYTCREWSACFASTNSSDYQTTITNNPVYSLESGDIDTYTFTVADTSYFTLGDSVLINSASGWFVAAILSSTSMKVYKALGTFPAAPLINQVIWRSAIPAVKIMGNSDQKVPANPYVIPVIACIYGRDYTVSTDANNVYKITFEDDFENYYFGYTGIYITNKQLIYYRAYNHDDLSHGTVLKELVEQSGLTVNQDSIDDANLTDITTNFSIPYFGEKEVKPIKEYISQLLVSTFGYIYFNNDFEICYKLIDAPNGTTEINDDYLKSTLKQSIDYKDLYTQINFQNIHGCFYFDTEVFGGINDTRRSDTLYNKYARYLHDTNKIKVINFITLNMDDAKTRIKNCLSNRRLKIEFSTKGINFSSLIGDDYLLVSDKIIGDSGQIEGKILGVTRKSNETNIIMLDLLGL